MKKILSFISLAAFLLLSPPVAAADSGRTENYRPREYALTDLPNLLPQAQAARTATPQPKEAQRPGLIAEVAGIAIVKSKREMYLLDKNNTILRTYKIALGNAPVGNKEREGDGKTPEGRYTVDFRNPNSEYFRSIRISYPSAADRERSRKLGHKSAGGDIFIHGTPPEKSWMFWRYSNLRDWTQGCVALSNKDMTEVWNLVNTGTPVLIKP
jgi:murein L,D-transpeptidase YafK